MKNYFNTKFIRTASRIGFLIAFFVVLPSSALKASEEGENETNLTTQNSSTLTLKDGSPLNSELSKDAFEWQNDKHYEAVIKIFEELADRELTSIIKRLIKVIAAEGDFFKDVSASVISMQQHRIFNWISNDVLKQGNYMDECNHLHSIQEDDSSEYSDDGVGPLARLYIRGYEGGEDSDDRSSSGGSSSTEGTENWSWEDPEDYISFGEDEAAFQRWQLDKLGSMFGIYIDYIEDFTEEVIDIRVIKAFLKEHCFGGGSRRYSWLLNEDIEGTLSVSENFAQLVHEDIDVPEQLIANILGGLWFDYDWEEFEIDDPFFLQNTYIKTLNDLHEGKRATDVRENLVRRIRDLFTFNHIDFVTPLKDIRSRYLEFNKRKNWLEALIEWSLYSTYRKVFSSPAKKSQIREYQTTTPSLPIFQSFNREQYLLKRLNDAYRRAHESYTKVYPHPDTKKIVFGPPSFHRAELDIQKALGQLRGVGRFLELSRKKGTENVFVPQLYFVVSSKPNQVSPLEGQQFFPVPLSFDELPRRPLTRAKEDVVFANVSNKAYFDRVKKDFVLGRTLQGKTKEEAEIEIEKLLKGAMVGRDQKLVHSERGVVHVLRQKKNVKKICEDFANHLRTSCGRGLYTVHGAVILGYSTNTVCPCCTPTLVALQNSREAGGFLNLLVQQLNSLKGSVTFHTAGYNGEISQMDWAQFRLNTFVTAKINFDSEAHDLAEEGQHSHGQVKKAPATHNPHAKLFFPNDEIDVSEPALLEDQTPDTHQRYFYEFVGKDMHSISIGDNPYIKKNTLKFPGVIFSSGSDPWGHGKMQ